MEVLEAAGEVATAVVDSTETTEVAAWVSEHRVQTVWVWVTKIVEVVVPTSTLVTPPVVCVRVTGHTVVVVSIMRVVSVTAGGAVVVEPCSEMIVVGAIIVVGAVVVPLEKITVDVDWTADGLVVEVS